MNTLTNQLSSLVEFKVDPKSLRILGNEYIEVSGKTVKLASKAYTDLTRIAKFSNAAMEVLNEKINERLGGAVLQKLLAECNHPTLTLYIDPHNKVIKRITDSNFDSQKSAVSHKLLENVVEWGMDQKNLHGKDIVIGSQHISNGGMTASIDIINKQHIGFGIKNEAISYGKSMVCK